MSKRARRIASIAMAGAVGSIGLVLAPSANAANFGVVSASAPLTDFATGTANPTDGAHATLIAAEKGNRSTFTLLVTGINAPRGTVFGAHVHVGACVADQPTTAGPHWRTAASDPVDALHEVWLDLRVRTGGYSISKAKIPYVIPDGAARSVVIHALPTTPSGTTAGSAGARLACLPVVF